MNTPKQNGHILHGVIIFLLLSILGVAIAGTIIINQKIENLGSVEKITEKNVENKEESESTTTNNADTLSVTIIDDTRCSDCQTAGLVQKLKSVPRIASAEVIEKDFSDEGVEELLKKHNILKLPAVIFNIENVDLSLNSYIKPTSAGAFYLEIGAKYDPFMKRSERGFRTIDLGIVENILTESYIKGDKNAEITWIEYSDIECPFCARLHSAGTEKALAKKYGNRLNITFHHFPLDSIHPNARLGGEVIECLGENKGIEAYYALIAKSFALKTGDPTVLIPEAGKLGGDQAAIQKCYDDGTFKQKVQKHLQEGNINFGITGTPGNVLINNKTGEYEVISGAMPTSEFEKKIDALLSE